MRQGAWLARNYSKRGKCGDLSFGNDPFNAAASHYDAVLRNAKQLRKQLSNDILLPSGCAIATLGPIPHFLPDQIFMRSHPTAWDGHGGAPTTKPYVSILVIKLTVPGTYLPASSTSAPTALSSNSHPRNHLFSHRGVSPSSFGGFAHLGAVFGITERVADFCSRRGISPSRLRCDAVFLTHFRSNP